MLFSTTTIHSTLESKEVKMKKYKLPTIEIIDPGCADIIMSSPGTETTPKEENDGIWDLDLA